MKKNRLILAGCLLVAGIITFIACQKGVTPAVSTAPTADQLVTASLQGRVLDENGLPVKGAAVTSGIANTTTDENGVFQFNNIQIYSRFGYVKVVKQGYFTGSRSILTHANAQNFVQINLLPRASTGTFPASSGGNITVQGNNTVAFDANSVVNASSNASYSGNVTVFATYLNPVAADLSKQMPGDLRGIRTTGEETGLQSFGMMAVELEGAAGEKLQIAAGKKATLTMAIPASLQASAPATIPLWYFNDSTGKWMEEGVATKQGSNYLGQVGHFTYWNCDVPSALIYFKVHLKDQNGNALAYTNLRFVAGNYGTSEGSTDSSGYAQGWIPKGLSMVLQVTDWCGNVLYSQHVGPALSDLELGTLSVTKNTAALTLTGTVVDCSNNPVASGFVNTTVEGLNYRAKVVNGSFSLSISRCNPSSTQAKLTAGDYGTQQLGSTDSLSVTSGNVNVGQLTACGQNFSRFVTVTLSGVNYSVTTPPDDSLYYYQPDSMSYIYSNTSASAANPKTINFGISNLNGIGTRDVYSLYIAIGSRHFNQTGYIQCTITAYGNVNGFIEGNFSGTVNDDLGNPYPVTGSFKVLRTI